MDDYGAPQQQGQGGKSQYGQQPQYGQPVQGSLPPSQRPSRGPTYAGGGAPTQRGGARMSNEQKEQKLRMDVQYQVKRNNLLTMMGKKSTPMLERALNEFMDMLNDPEKRSAEDDLLHKANYELRYLKFRDRLWEAMGMVSVSSSPEGTPRAGSGGGGEGGAGAGGVPQPSLSGINAIFLELEQPENVTFKDPLTPELMQARLLRMELSRNLKIPSRLEFDDKTMRTLRQYSSPPPAVHDVVVAFFLIFGEYEGYTRDWTYCRRMLKPFGRNEGFSTGGSNMGQKGGLRARIEAFNIGEVNGEIAAMSNEILRKYTLAEICQKSESVASFYLWTSDVIEQLSANGGLAELQPVDPHNDPDGSKRKRWLLKRQRDIFGIDEQSQK